MKVLLFAIFASVTASLASGLLQRAGKKSSAASEALKVFKTKFSDRTPVKAAAWRKIGMPYRDIDGTTYKITKTGELSKRLTDISDKDALASFDELAKLYGAEEALGMVKTMPIILAFNRKEFAGCRKEWKEIFGDEESKAMVIRNPGLLAVRAFEAGKATDQTMTFSYIVAATRPAGAFLLAGTFALLLSPLLEAVTGIPIRTTFLASLSGAEPAEVARTLNALSIHLSSSNK